ncbi:hypothetical protein VTK56DRAFT_7947 [Thermocarpiscus australiensis]
MYMDRARRNQHIYLCPGRRRLEDVQRSTSTAPHGSIDSDRPDQQSFINHPHNVTQEPNPKINGNGLPTNPFTKATPHATRKSRFKQHLAQASTSPSVSTSDQLAVGKYQIRLQVRGRETQKIYTAVDYQQQHEGRPRESPSRTAKHE